MALAIAPAIRPKTIQARMFMSVKKVECL
jgi:hypothetical protein